MASNQHRMAGNPANSPARQGAATGRTGRGFESTDAERQRPTRGDETGKKTAAGKSGATPEIGTLQGGADSDRGGPPGQRRG